MISFWPNMAENMRSGAFQIHSEARGAHWVAWVAREGNKPDRSVIIVGKDQEEAEAHARAWAESAY